MTSIKKTNAIFFGTPEFAIPALKALIKSSFVNVALVVTQPDKPIGRHHSRLVPSPVKKLAQEAGIGVYDGDDPSAILEPRRGDRIPEVNLGSLSSPTDSAGSSRATTKYDLGIVSAYGEILPKKILDSFPLGVLNIHPSLLPKYRGPSPIQTAILNRDKETGVTIIKLDDKMDHGPIVAQETPRIFGASLQKMTAGELHNKLAQVGADLLIKILPDYIAGKIAPEPQNHQAASYTEKLTKESGKIDWSKSPQEIDALVRAMNPRPGAWTMWEGRRLIIWRYSLESSYLFFKSSRAQRGISPKKKSEGQSWDSSALPRNDKVLSLQEVQLEGKKRMAFAEFLKGHPDFNFNQLSG